MPGKAESGTVGQTTGQMLVAMASRNLQAMGDGYRARRRGKPLAENSHHWSLPEHENPRRGWEAENA